MTITCKSVINKVSHLVPIHYIHHQTPNAKQHIVFKFKLKEYEDKVFTSKSKALGIEEKLYEELLDLLLPHLSEFRTSTEALLELDVLSNLAELAETLDYRCPISI